MKELRNSIENTYRFIKEYFNNVVKDKFFYIPLLLSMTIAYSFNLFQRTISIDDLAQHVYYGSDMLKIKGLRWGQLFVNRIFSTLYYTPFLNRFLGLIFLVLTVIVIGTIFYYFDKNKDKKIKYIIFSSLFVTYPLIVEFYEYFEVLTIPFNFLIVSLCALFLLINKSNIKNILFTGFLLSFVMSGYESLTFAYITIVFVILFFEHVINNEKGNWFIEGLGYAYPLVVGLVLRFVIGYGLIIINGTHYMADGASSINWISLGFKDALLQVLYNGWYYGIRGLSYLPITEFVVALIVFITICIVLQIKKHVWSLLLGAMLVASLFFLAIVQGGNLAYRAAQTVHLFVGFVTYLFIYYIEDLEIKTYKLKPIMVFLFLFLIFRQSVSIHQILALDNQRSDNEAYVAQTIGYKLVNEFDLSKPVVFCGKYNLGENITSKIYVDENSFVGKIEKTLRDKFGLSDEKYDLPVTQSILHSVWTWISDSPWQSMGKEYLACYGYDITVIDDLSTEEIKRYEEIAKKNDLKPLTLLDNGDVIIVYLG